MQKHKVLIVGGGFGGVKAALELCAHDNLDVTLITDRDDFRYYPTFYHTATGGLKTQSSIPLQEILEESVQLVVTTAAKLDRQTRHIITTDDRRYPYDTLIMSLGTVTNYFGIEGLEEHSYSIKTIEGITRFKDHLHQQLADEHKPDLHYVIVGAGPTGIELAGALPAYLRKIMHNHGIKHRAVRIELIEAAPRLLPRSHKSISRAVSRRLRKLGVHVLRNQAVQGQNTDAIIINGKPLKSHTVVWTAGMANNPFFKTNGFVMAERGKVQVNQYLEAEPDIYIIGDNAGTQYSGLAQTALYDAEFVASNLVAKLRRKPQQAYVPKQPVSIIPVGANWAAVEWGKVRFSGRLGWLLRSAADWIGFRDLQPWWKASEQWLTEFGSQEDCLTCEVVNQQGPDDILQSARNNKR